jgi:hypothetical protein
MEEVHHQAHTPIVRSVPCYGPVRSLWRFSVMTFLYSPDCRRIRLSPFRAQQVMIELDGFLQFLVIGEPAPHFLNPARGVR